jgi:hypothetical protein
MAIRTVGQVRVFTTFGLVAAVACGFWLGRGGSQGVAVAAPQPPKAAAEVPAAPPVSPDYKERVVAYIYGSVPITREDLGEYMIARHGLDNVELLVNKKIIELACEKRNITVADAEIDAAILADCESIGVNKRDFVMKVLKQYGKTMFEWKQDVIKPRLLLTKLVKDKVAQPTEEEVHKAFDAVYGEKRDCRIIIWPPEPAEERAAMKEYDDIRKSEEGFDRKARTQANSALAATGGRIKPIAHNSGVHAEVEKAAFSLQPGEVSALIKTQKEGTIVLKMDKIVPPEANVKFEDKREMLAKDVYEKKVTAEIPKLFQALREEAKPVFILKRQVDFDEEAVRKELEQTGGKAPPKP